ncbi:alpha/beta fold hydrolase [Gordonia westfalica]|uniref:Alpha/beta fold hydrolase n=1 Tax=Gordonia westfalica TaxID=158898 RepID=A0ABU2GNV5_9ACTN|nr:alpha/beta fold hydrolase [Gordonia westfalica]MDS1113141.1 alpha/beta fold hydrolase [Gordonia westfalica]
MIAHPSISEPASDPSGQQPVAVIPAAGTHAPVTPVDLDLDCTLADALERAAAAYGEAPALRLRDNAITYRELLARARGVAAHIQRIRPDGGPVVAQFGLSQDSVAVVVGILLTGRPLVTLDPALPTERIDSIVDALVTRELRPGLVVADAEHLETLSICAARRGVIAVGFPEILASAPDVASTALPDRTHAATTSSAIANIQFTSGSTGGPKGVLQPDSMWLNDALYMRASFGLTPGLPVALCMPISFAAGLNVLISSLLNGCEILLADPRRGTPTDLLASMAQTAPHTVFLTPSLLRSLNQATPAGTEHPGWVSLRRIITTGEPLSGEVATATVSIAPESTVTNWVGSSETLAIGHFDVRAGSPPRTGPLPAGTPALNKILTIDDDGRVLISSPHIALGYLDPENNEDKFFHDESGRWTFRSGDRGMFDGTDLILLGRAEDAVKIRGYRVEPAEVGAALLSAGDVAEAVVVPRESRSGNTELVAYVVPSGHGRTPPTAVLRNRLRTSLPQWMIPAHIVELSELPRNARGKVDRTALPAPTRNPEAPAGPLETAIAEIWGAELSLDDVGRDENIYALGADSLTIQQIMVRLNDSLSVGLTQSDVAGAPTVAELASVVERRKAGASSPRSHLAPTTVLLRRAEGRPVFCFTGAGASTLTFVALADRIGEIDGAGSVFAFQPNGLENRGIPDWTVAAAARRHLRDLRRIQSEGPYVLIGHSLGGFIALEAARRLEAEGQRVDLVVAVDTFLPPRVIHHAKRADPSVKIAPSHAPLPSKELWRRRLRVPFAGLVKGSPTADAQALEELGVRVGRLHRPRPFGGRVLIVQGSENHDDPTIWRQHIATGELETLRLECDHLSIVREPHIGDIVGAMRDALRRGTQP